MHHLLGPYSDHALALLRIVAGFLFLCHGAQKFGLIEPAERATSPIAQAPAAGRPATSGQLPDVSADTSISRAPSAWTDRLRLPAGRRLVAGVIEVVGGACMMVGLVTSSVAFVASGLMAFAYFLAHAPQGFYPLFNRGEPAVLFCFIWLYFATRPPGKLALDNVLFRPRRQEARERSRVSRAS